MLPHTCSALASSRCATSIRPTCRKVPAATAVSAPVSALSATCEGGGTVIRFEIPVASVSLTNEREHWWDRVKRVRAERKAAWACYLAAPGFRQLGPAETAVVTLTRRGPRKLDDDNLRGALKTVRDQLAAGLGVDDGVGRVAWRYGQERSPRPGVSVEIRIGG